MPRTLVLLRCNAATTRLVFWSVVSRGRGVLGKGVACWPASHATPATHQQPCSSRRPLNLSVGEISCDYRPYQIRVLKKNS